MAEDARRDVLRDAILNLPEKFGYAIVDNDGFNSYNQVVRDDAMKGLKTGDAFKADTLEGLAKQMGVPADQLKKTIADYNAMVDQKKDPTSVKQNAICLTRLKKLRIGPHCPVWLYTTRWAA